MPRRPVVWSLIITAACGLADRDPGSQLFSALEDTRPFELRFGFEQPRPCPMHMQQSLRLKSRCDDAVVEERTLRRLEAIAGTFGDDPAQPHASAILRLVFPSPYSRDVDDAITALNEAHAAKPDDVAILNALAIAHAERAARLQHPLEAFLALDYAERAARADPTNEVVLFNRAVLLERTRQLATARAAWSHFIESFRRSAWIDEAAERHARLDSVLSLQRELPGLDESDPWRQLATRDPQAAREVATDSLLVQWAHAQLASDSAAAVRALNAAAVIGDQLIDRSIVGTVPVIRSASAESLRSLARGLVAWGEGNRAFGRGEFEMAAVHLRTSLDQLGDKPAPVRVWPTLLLAAVEIYRGEHDRAVARYTRVLDEMDADRYPAVHGRAHWGLGLSYIRQGAITGAIRHDELALAAFERIGERVNAGAINMLLAEANALIGFEARAAEHAWRAFDLLSQRPVSTHLHNLIALWGAELSSLGMPLAGVSVQTEGLDVARHTGREKDPVEARTRLAAAELAARQYDAARAHLEEARELAARLSDPIMRTRMTADLLQAGAELQLATGSTPSIPELSDAIEYYRSQGVPIVWSGPLMRRGLAWLAHGDTARAVSDLREALSIVQAEAARTRSPVARAALLEQSTAAWDALIAVQAARQDLHAALATLESSRVGVAAVDLPRSGLPADVALIEYAVLPDRLLVAATTADTVLMSTVSITAAALADRVAEFESRVRHARSSDVFETSAVEIYDVLIRPIMSALDGIDELVVIPDKSLHRLPFAALREARGAYLVERFVLRFEATSRSALARAADLPVASTGPVLVVEDPAFDTRSFPDLRPLRAAVREARNIAAVWPSVRTISGSSATRDAVLSGLDDATIFHFAGHARYNVLRPEQSQLILASAADADPGVLFASDMEGRSWNGLRLVVLSACETIGAATGRNGGFAALARAFMAAGAEGVVGTLWETDDARAADFATTFHRHLAAGLTPAEALAATQRSAIASMGPGSTSPSIWAAYRLEGR